MIKKLLGIQGLYTPPPPPTLPRDYYISAAGTGDGLTSGAPGPLALLQSAVFITNDNIFLKKGDTL